MYEPEQDLKILLDDADNRLRISRATLASLSGVPASAISKAHNGLDDLPYVKFRELRILVDDLLELQRRAGDIRIDWSDFRASRRLLDQLRAERANPPQPLTPEESMLISKFVNTPFENLCAELGTHRADLLHRVEGILARATRIAKMRQ